MDGNELNGFTLSEDRQPRDFKLSDTKMRAELFPLLNSPADLSIRPFLAADQRRPENVTRTNCYEIGAEGVFKEQEHLGNFGEVSSSILFLSLFTKTERDEVQALNFKDIYDRDYRVLFEFLLLFVYQFLGNNRYQKSHKVLEV